MSINSINVINIPKQPCFPLPVSRSISKTSNNKAGKNCNIINKCSEACLNFFKGALATYAIKDLLLGGSYSRLVINNIMAPEEQSADKAFLKRVIRLAQTGLPSRGIHSNFFDRMYYGIDSEAIFFSECPKVEFLKQLEIIEENFDVTVYNPFNLIGNVVVAPLFEEILVEHWYKMFYLNKFQKN